MEDKHRAKARSSSTGSGLPNCCPKELQYKRPPLLSARSLLHPTLSGTLIKGACASTCALARLSMAAGFQVHVAVIAFSPVHVDEDIELTTASKPDLIPTSEQQPAFLTQVTYAPTAVQVPAVSTFAAWMAPGIPK